MININSRCSSQEQIELSSFAKPRQEAVTMRCSIDFWTPVKHEHSTTFQHVSFLADRLLNPKTPFITITAHNQARTSAPEQFCSEKTYAALCATVVVPLIALVIKLISRCLHSYQNLPTPSIDEDSTEADSLLDSVDWDMPQDNQVHQEDREEAAAWERICRLLDNSSSCDSSDSEI